MGTSRDTSERARHGKRRRRQFPARLSHLGDGASSSSALPLQNAELPDDTPTEDPGNNVSLAAFRGVLEEPPPLEGATARLQADGRPPPGATLEAQGRPPPEAPKVEGEEDFFLDLLPANPARFEIMDRIPPPLTLPSKELFDLWEECIQGHRPNGQYG